MPQEKTIKINVDAGDGIKKVDELKKGVEGVDQSSKGAKSGLGGMTGATNKLGVAFKAIGIGLIVTAFMKLKDLFSGNIETARKFEVAGAKISAMFDVLRDRAEPLFMSLSKLFTDPLGSLKEFANAIKENLINRVKGLIDTFGALGKVVKGVFTRDMDLLKEGMSEAKTATIQLATGLDEVQQSKVADTFKDITKEIKEETKAAGKLTEAMQGVRDSERDMLLVRANANKIIAESRLLAEDDTKSMEERLVALKAAVAEEQRVAALEMDIQRQKVAAMQEMIDLGKSSEEDMQALAQERANLVELETASILKQKRVAAEIGSFTNQIEKEKQAGIKATADAKAKALDKEEADAKLAADNKKMLQEKAISDVIAILGEESKAAKAIQVGMAIRDTYLGATKALAQGGIFGALSAGGIIAMGLANVKKIMSTGDEGASAGGGGVSSSGIDTDAGQPAVVGDMLPNMESIAGPTLGESQPVQAYVVENDISNAQALQEELEIQATL